MVFDIFLKVENEYGSYFTCDHQYMSHLQEVFEQHLGIKRRYTISISFHR